MESVVLNETIKQGIFASEREMSQMEDTKLLNLTKKMQTEAKCKPLQNT